MSLSSRYFQFIIFRVFLRFLDFRLFFIQFLDSLPLSLSFILYLVDLLVLLTQIHSQQTLASLQQLKLFQHLSNLFKSLTISLFPFQIISF